jgi:hypothetical protein
MTGSVIAVSTPSASAPQSVSAGRAPSDISSSRSAQELHPRDDDRPAVTPLAIPGAGTASSPAGHPIHAAGQPASEASLSAVGFESNQQIGLVATWVGQMSLRGRGTISAVGSVRGAQNDDLPPNHAVFRLRDAVWQRPDGEVTALLQKCEGLMPEDVSAALHDAAEVGRFKVMLTLAAHPGVVDTEDDGVTALRKAINYQRETPLDRKARNLLAQVRSALLPAAVLREAAELGEVDRFARVFCGEVDRPDRYSMSEALREAARLGYPSIVQGLLDRGCPPQDEDELLKTALHYALENRHPDVICVLQEHGAIDSPDIRRQWASLMAEALARENPGDAVAAEIDGLLLRIRSQHRELLQENGIDLKWRRPAENLMEILPVSARQGRSAGTTYWICLILAEEHGSPGGAWPLQKWAEVLGVGEDVLAGHRNHILECLDESVHDDWLPSGLRATAGPHLAQPGRAAVLTTSIVLSTIVHHEEGMSVGDARRLCVRVADVIGTLKFDQAGVLAAEHYLRKLPFAELHAELHAAVVREEHEDGAADALALTGYRLACSCLMLAELHQRSSRLESASWGVSLKMTASEVEAFKDKLLDHLDHNLAVPELDFARLLMV